MIYNISQELGALEDYHISKTSAKIRLCVNGLEPITKETIVEFDTGEELPVYLEYEDLEQHCSICNSLCHLSTYCPTKPSAEIHVSTSQQSRWEGRKNSSTMVESHRERTQDTRIKSPRNAPRNRETPFHQRLDRHGRPFGDRIPLPSSQALGPRNKITPPHSLEEGYQRNNQASLTHHTRTRSPREPQQRTTSNTNHTPQLQWRARERTSQPSNHVGQTEKENLPVMAQQRPPLECNLAENDFPPQAHIPTTEEVMEELREVTFQYTNCNDPIERAARVQRVIHGEEEGLMAETAARIVEAASSNLEADARQLLTTIPELEAEEQTNQLEIPRNDRPESSNAQTRRIKSSRSTRVAASPRSTAGMSIRKRNFYQLQTPPARQGFPFASPVENAPGHGRRNTTGRQQTPRRANTASQGNPQDFHADQCRLP